MKPKRPPPPPLGRRAMETPYGGNPFGPFQDPDERARDKAQDPGSPWRTFSEGPFDLRGRADWMTVMTLKTTSYTWGSINADARCKDVDGLTDLTLSCHAEIRVLGFIGGAPFVIAEDALGNHIDRAEELSCGPFRHVLWPGEMPDSIEVQMRARRGGLAETVVDASEVLDGLVQARFHRGI